MRLQCLILCLLLLFTSCDSGKKLMEEGNRNYLAGNFDDAATYFYNVLLRNPKNIEAQQALKKTGNIVLNAKFSSFGKYVIENNSESAVRQYLSCKKYYKKVQEVNVELDWPHMYDEVYEDIKNEFISKQYDEGLILMQQNKYEKAENIFLKLSEFDPNYKEATVLRPGSIIEPVYLNGIRMMEIKNYKQAYQDFTKVLKQDDNYKDAIRLKSEALKMASIGLGILSVQNQTQSVGFDKKLYQQIFSTLIQRKSPFLQIVDQGQIDRYLPEKDERTIGITNPESAGRVGKIMGLNYVLMIALSNLQNESYGPKTDSIPAFEAITETTLPNGTNIPRNITIFKKVQYADTYQKNRIFYQVFYQLVSTQTGQVVVSDLIKEEQSDEFHSKNYQGNINTLFPELPKDNLMPTRSIEWKEQFNSVKRTVLSMEVMTQNVCEIIAAKMFDDIKVYIEK